MKKALIMTLGFDEKFCYRAVLRHGMREGDVIVLLTASLVDRVKRAYDWIRVFAESYDIKVELVEIDVRDFYRALKKVIELLDELRDYSLIVNLSGGMRALAIIVLIALTIKPMRNLRVEIELEDFSGLIEIPKDVLRLSEIRARMGEEKMEILKLVREGFKDVKSIADKLKKDVSTVRRHIYSLIEWNLLEVVKKKPLIVKLTELAEIFLSAKP